MFLETKKFWSVKKNSIKFHAKLYGIKSKIDIFGVKLGEFSRCDILTTEDFEMMVVTENKTIAHRLAMR